MSLTEPTLRAALMLLCLLIFALAFAVLLLAAWRHHRADKADDGANFHSALWVEISWTVVPVLIVLGAVWPAVRAFF